MHLDSGTMAPVVRRLRRAQGQLNGVIHMIEEGRDCEEIITQLAAVSKAIDRASFHAISLALRQCLAEPDAAQKRKRLEKLFLSLA